MYPAGPCAIIPAIDPWKSRPHPAVSAPENGRSLGRKIGMCAWFNVWTLNIVMIRVPYQASVEHDGHEWDYGLGDSQEAAVTAWTIFQETMNQYPFCGHAAKHQSKQDPLVIAPWTPSWNVITLTGQLIECPLQDGPLYPSGLWSNARLHQTCGPIWGPRIGPERSVVFYIHT